MRSFNYFMVALVWIVQFSCQEGLFETPYGEGVFAQTYCPVQELQTALGDHLVEGSTVGESNCLQGSCGGQSAPESRFHWQAPFEGRFFFNTFGSRLSTILYALDQDLEGVELACNDMANPETYQSEIVLDLIAGQEIVIVVDGFRQHQGDFVLTIQADSENPIEEPDDPWDGLSGEDLRHALFQEVDRHQRLSYDAARQVMFTDLDNTNNRVECVYTGQVITTHKVPNANLMNTEHTWAKSWEGSTSTSERDLHHLFPSMNNANARRGALHFGEVVSVNWSQGGSSLGYDESGRLVFEPRDEHKGDLARSLFYFAVRYQTQIEDQEERILKRWNQEDPPDDKEKSRNDRIESYQLKRNPFVDYPHCADRIHDF